MDINKGFEWCITHYNRKGDHMRPFNNNKEIKTWRCSIAGSYYPKHLKCFAGILLVLRFTRWLRLLWGFLNLLSLLFQYLLWRLSSPFQACRACVLCSRIVYELPNYQDSYRSLTKIANNFVNLVSNWCNDTKNGTNAWDRLWVHCT